MPKQQKTRERVFDSKLKEMKQIVALGDDAVLITSEFDADVRMDEIHLLFRGDCYLTKADTEAQAVTNLADPGKRRRAVKGETISYFRTSGKIWAKKAGSQVANIDKEVYEQGND